MSDGKKRKLIISDTLRADGGEISVKTNTDKSKCNLKVAFANKFITVKHCEGKLNIADLFTKEDKDVSNFCQIRDVLVQDPFP